MRYDGTHGATGPRHRADVSRPGRRRTTVVLAVLAVSMGLVVPSAQARKDDDTVKERSGCRGDTTSWTKLKAAPEDGGLIQVSGIVFSDDDDVWEWKLKHNDDVSAKGSVKARDADRSFKIVRNMADFTGTDDIEFRAENTVNGEICRATLEY